jgi:hypothetical protein
MWVRAKFGTCTDVSVYETLVEDKVCRFNGECAHFSFNQCPIYTHDGESAKFSTISHEADNSAGCCLKQIIFNLSIAEIDSGGELLVTSEVSLQGHHTVQV